MDVVTEVRNHLRNLPPYVAERKTASLLTQLVIQTERLQEKCFNDAMAAKKSGYEDGAKIMQSELEQLQAEIERRREENKMLQIRLDVVPDKVRLVKPMEAELKRLRGILNHVRMTDRLHAEDDYKREAAEAGKGE